MGRAVVIVLDSFGLGLPQAAHAASGQSPAGMCAVDAPVGVFGAAAEVSSGKDTPSGHWELMGCPVPFEWGHFARRDDGASVFPPEPMQRWIRGGDLAGTIGTCHASASRSSTASATNTSLA